MIWLLVSIALLGIGPLAYHFAHRAPWALRLLEIFVVVSVGALVILHIIPETVEQGGFIALVPLVIGILGPTLVEGALKNVDEKAHAAVLVVVLVGLALHAMIDGVALVLPHDGESFLDASLPLAVVLHRIPVSVLIWWLIRPRYGVFLATLALTIEGSGTTVGFFAAHALVPHLASNAVVALQALVAGSLLHIVVDRKVGRPHVH